MFLQTEEVVEQIKASREQAYTAITSPVYDFAHNVDSVSGRVFPSKITFECIKPLSKLTLRVSPYLVPLPID